MWHCTKCQWHKILCPYLSQDKKQQTNLQIYDKGKVISTIRFSFMILAFDEVLKFKDFKNIAKNNPNYAALLHAEYLYCSSHQKAIKDKALAVYNWM